MLLDGEALTASRFDCLASHNPVVALHLSAKETNAIAKKAPYVGMREEAFLLTAGSPSKVDFMNIKFQPSYVWKYDQPGLEAKHFIFRNSHLKSLK